MSNQPQPSFMDIGPLPPSLKARCIHAARNMRIKLVPWAIQMLTLACETSEEEEKRSQAQQVPVTCSVAREDGFVCTLSPGHKGWHQAINSQGRIIKQWPR